MTTDNNDITQMIDQAQQELDAEQGIVETTSDVSQVQALQDQLASTNQQIKELSGMVHASRGHVDRALNSIRQDTTLDRTAVETILDERLSLVNDRMRQEQLLEGLTEDQRPIFEHLLNKLDGFEKGNVSESAPQQSQQEPSQGGSDAWQDIYDMVSDMGINQADPRIQYRLLLDETITPRQSQSNFLTHLMTMRDGNPENQMQSQPTNRATGQNPPVESMSPSSTTALRNADDIRDAYIAGTITTDVYHEKMGAIGENV